MIENRTERVDPSMQNYVVNTLAHFGWQLAGAQEIYNESSEVTGMEIKSYGPFMQGFTGKDGRIDVHRTKHITNYMTLHFRRDTNMPHYAEIKELENDYFIYGAVTRPEKPTKRTVAAALFLLVMIAAFIGMLSTGDELFSPEDLLIYGAFIVLVIFTVVGWVQYKKKQAKYDFALTRCSDLWDRAEMLMSGKTPNVVDLLLDENNKEPLLLTDDNGKQISFEQVAVIPYDNKIYCVLKPLDKIDYIAENEALVFYVQENPNEEPRLMVETNDDIAQIIFDEYNRMCDEADNA